MDKVLFNVVYNRKKKKLSENDTALIQIEAYLKGRKKYFSTNIYIKSDQWDKRHRQIKNHTNKDTLNKQIRDFVDKLEEIEMKRRQNNKPFTLNYLKEYTQNNYNSSFIDFCNREIEADNQLRQSTKQQQQITCNHLKQFKNDISFEDITFEFLTNFENYLRELNHNQNTIFKHFSIIRRFVNRAIDKELFDLNNYPFRKFRLKQGKSKRDFLTPEELEKIENLRLTARNKIYQTALDKYLFAVYTGLRFSDVAALKPQNLVIIDGKEWLIIYEIQKTGEPLRIPIYLLFEGKALDIIYKYIGKENSVFPYQTNQNVNDHLKEIATIAGIDKKITFHTARHTQATYLLYKGVSITTVQKLLGHKNIKTTLIYSKVMDMTVINELKNVSFSK